MMLQQSDIPLHSPLRPTPWKNSHSSQGRDPYTQTLLQQPQGIPQQNSPGQYLQPTYSPSAPAPMLAPLPSDVSPLQRRLRHKTQRSQVHFQEQPQEFPSAETITTVVPGMHAASQAMYNHTPNSVHQLQQQQQLQMLQFQQQQLQQVQQQQQQQGMQFQVNYQRPQQQFLVMTPNQLSAQQFSAPHMQFAHQSSERGYPEQGKPPHQFSEDLNWASHDQYRQDGKQAKQVQRIEQRRIRAEKSQFPYPLIMANEWKAFCRDFTPPPDMTPVKAEPSLTPAKLVVPGNQTTGTYDVPDNNRENARFLEIQLTVDDTVRKSNPVEVVLHGLIQFGPVEIIRTCTDKNMSKWQRRHQRIVLVQMFTAEAAESVYKCGTIEAGQCLLKVLGPPQPAPLHVTCHNVCLFAYEVHRLSDGDLLQILKKVVHGVTIEKAKKRVERSLVFDTVDEARTCISVLQKPLLETFNVLLYAYSNGSEEGDAGSPSDQALGH